MDQLLNMLLIPITILFAHYFFDIISFLFIATLIYIYISKSPKLKKYFKFLLLFSAALSTLLLIKFVSEATGISIILSIVNVIITAWIFTKSRT